MSWKTIQLVRSGFVPRSDQKDYLGLIDIEAFAKLQISISGPIGKSTTVGSPSSVSTLLLGEGGSFVVSRVSNSAFAHSLDTWDDAFDKTKGFVVVKQPTVKNPKEDGFESRLYDAMMELKVSYHEPLRKHPNIVHLHSFMWDIQSNDATALAPSLIMEYADLGTVSDFQHSEKLILHSDAKVQICLDVAEGMSFLHQCGIIHGDMKCENIFLFRDKIHEKHRATAIRAKIGDFGCALIGVLDEPDSPKQELRAHSPYWEPPEKVEEMNALNLRKMDMYSYGLAIWRVNCNGEVPYKNLSWDPSHENITSEPSTPAKPLNPADFLAFKRNGNALLGFAIDTLRNRPKSDVDFETMQDVLKKALDVDPNARATNFDEIIKALRPTSPKEIALSNPTPKPLKAGDFGITDSRFPHFIYLLRTTPASFRSLICDQLTTYSQTSNKKSKRALYHLALGVCHWQKFYSCTGWRDIPSSQDRTFVEAGAEEILEAAELGNPIAQSLAPRAFSLSGREGEINRGVLEKWLVNSMRHGSIRGRNELRKQFPTRFTLAVATTKEARQNAATLLSSEETTPYAQEFFEQIVGLDPAAKGVLTQPGATRLHQAAYLGANLVCQALLDNFNINVDATNAKGETPLHYAARNGQLHTVKYLLERGANINAQRDYGACALHMAFCSYDTEAILELLLARGADPELSSQGTLDQLPDRSDYFMVAIGTPLHLSVRFENIEAALVLLRNGANLNHKIEFAGSPLRAGLQLHSMPLMEFLMQWAVKNLNNLPMVHELYSSLVGFYAQPMYRYLYWGDESSLKFALPAMEYIKKLELEADERILLSWALDADDSELADYYLNKFCNTERHMLRNFRDLRVGDTGEVSQTQDFVLSPDLHHLFSMVLSVCSKEMIKTVLKYTTKPLPPRGPFGQPIFCQLASRQTESKEDLSEIVSWLIEVGVKVEIPGTGSGPLQNAVVWNNANLADILLDYKPSFRDVEAAMQRCVVKGHSLTAEKIMRSIFKKYPQVLTVPLPKPNYDHFQLPPEQSDPNYIRAICSRVEFSQQKNLHAAILREAIQETKKQPGGKLAIKKRLDEYGNLLMTPLHYASKHGNIDAAKILLEEGANINAYSIYPAKGADVMDLSTFTCTSDLSKLDEKQKTWVLANSGPTPLDEAYDRDWDMSLYQWLPSDQNLLMEFRLAGGSNKEEAEYNTRTQNIVNFLKSRGAKTRYEIFGQPDSHQQEREARLKASREQFKKKHVQQPSSDTSNRIRRLWGLACALHSAPITQVDFPGLLTRADPTRPRFSKLFANSMAQFRRILLFTLDSSTQELHVGIERELSRYTAWAEKNHVEEAQLDEVADVPVLALSGLLSASILITLREIGFTLKYIEELHSDHEFIDRSYRYKELLNDLTKAVDVLTSEEKELKVLSDSAVVEIEEKLQISMKDVNLDGSLKI